mgnify:FL=1
MVDFESRLNKMETDLAAVKEKISFFNVIYEKFDKTLDKLDERQIEDRKEINEMMAVLQDNIMKEIKALRDEMQRQHQIENKKIDELNKWRWIVMGAAAIVGWIISKVVMLTK